MDQGEAMEFRAAVADANKAAGETFEIERDGQLHTADGMNNSKENHVTFLPEADVQTGDVLRGTVTKQVFYVTDVASSVIHGKVFQLRARCETEAQRARRLAAESKQDAPFSIGSIGTVQGSILGTQHTATLITSFDLRSLELEIDKRGGRDAEALKAMIGEIRDMLDDREKISKGSLAEFSELMEKHSWIAGAVAQALLGWAMGSLKL